MTLLLVTLLVDHEVLNLISLCTASAINLCSIESKGINPVSPMSAPDPRNHLAKD
jgi:hypothetical protein